MVRFILAVVREIIILAFGAALALLMAIAVLRALGWVVLP
jgi:hypothetical protein